MNSQWLRDIFKKSAIWGEVGGNAHIPIKSMSSLLVHLSIVLVMYGGLWNGDLFRFRSIYIFLFISYRRGQWENIWTLVWAAVQLRRSRSKIIRFLFKQLWFDLSFCFCWSGVHFAYQMAISQVNFEAHVNAHHGVYKTAVFHTLSVFQILYSNSVRAPVVLADGLTNIISETINLRWWLASDDLFTDHSVRWATKTNNAMQRVLTQSAPRQVNVPWWRWNLVLHALKSAGQGLT